MKIVEVMEKIIQVRMFKNGINIINKSFPNIGPCSTIDIAADIHEQANIFLIWFKILKMLVLLSQHHPFVGKN